jgi:hypothetical protein
VDPAPRFSERTFRLDVEGRLMNAPPLPFDLKNGDHATVVNDGHESHVIPETDMRKMDATSADMNADAFDWAHDDSVVLRHQPGVAVYINQRDDLVIRQEGQYHPDEDVFIYISPNNIHDVIDKLCEVVGIPRVGRPR